MNTGIKGIPGRLIFIVFLLALLVRTIYIFQVLQFPLTEYMTGSNTFDQHGFDRNATSIASGKWQGAEEVFKKEPFYSYFLAFIYVASGYSHYMVYIVQALLTSIAVILIYKICRYIFNSVTGYIAAFALALYPVSIFYDAMLLRASVLMSLNILLCYLLLKSLKKDRAYLWFVSGIVLGITVLTRHNMLLPFIFMFMLLSIKPLKKALKNILILSAGFLIVIMPILVRNYIISEENVIRISSETSAFWVGNTHDSAGVDLEWPPEYYRLEQASEGGFRKTASFFLAEVKKRPKKYLKLYARKAKMFFNGYEVPANANYYLYRQEFSTILRMMFLDFRLICGLGILGVMISLFRKRKPLLIYIFLTVLSMSVILFHIQSRYRLPAVPFFIIFASYAIYSTLDYVRRRRPLESIALIILAALLYVALKPDLTYAGFRSGGYIIRAQDRINLALAYIDDYKRHKNNDALSEALRQCNIAVAQERNSCIPYSMKAHIYFLEQDFSASVNEYKKALIFDSDNAFLYNELAGVYFQNKQYEKALVYTRRALRLFPGNEIFERNLELVYSSVNT